MINIGIIEDDLNFQKTLVSIINKEEGLKVVMKIQSLEELFQIFPKLLGDIDIILLDIKLQHTITIDSIPAIRKLFPRVKIILVSALLESGVVFSAIQHQVDGYYLKNSSLSLIQFIKAVANGSTMFDPVVMELLSNRLTQNSQRQNAFGFTPKEMEIANLLAQGISYKLTAQKMGSSVNTIRQHVRSIYRKAKVNSKTELFHKLHDFL